MHTESGLKQIVILMMLCHVMPLIKDLTDLDGILL